MEIYLNDELDLPAKKLSGGGVVKLPYDKVIPFEEFQADMNRRKQDSLLLKLYE